MKVLITGCTASQTRPGRPTFSNFINDSLIANGHTVAFASKPSITYTMKDLSEYDKVLVGIAPPTSVTAYTVYPAFSIAYKAWKLGNLEMFVDAPEPHKLQASINSCRNGKSDLTKDFYSRRKNYFDFIEENQLRNEVNGFIEFLFGRKWPNTYYPAFPWSSPNNYAQHLVMGGNSIIPVEVDGWLFETTPTTSKREEGNYWVYDSNSVWTRGIRETLSQELVPAQNKPLETEETILPRVAGALGSLVSVYRQGQPWWSPLLAQSLQQGVPVITDWRHTSFMGASWSYLASTVEEMNPEDREWIAGEQKEAYLRHAMTWEESSERLTGLLSGSILVSSA